MTNILREIISIFRIFQYKNHINSLALDLWRDYSSVSPHTEHVLSIFADHCANSKIFPFCGSPYRKVPSLSLSLVFPTAFLAFTTGTI